MTPEEFAAAMRKIAGNDNDPEDIEAAHIDADDLMCGLLDSLGYGEGVRIFAAMPKWYA